MATKLTLARIIKRHETDHRPPIIFRDDNYIYCYAGSLVIQDDPALTRLAEREQLLALEPVPVVHPITIQNRKIQVGQSRKESADFEKRLREYFSPNQQLYPVNLTPSTHAGYKEPTYCLEVGLEASKRAGGLGVVVFAKLFDYLQQTTGGQPHLSEIFDQVYFINEGKVRAFLCANVAYRSPEELERFSKGQILTDEQKKEIEKINQEIQRR